MADFTFTQLTPTAFLERAAHVFGERTAVVDGDRRFTYTEYYERSLRLTGLLAALGVEPGDRVAALCTNSHVLLELHHGVPMRGAVLVPLNIRLSEPELRYIVEHSGAKLIVATHELADRARAVGSELGVRVVVAGGDDEYETLLASPDPAPVPVGDERSPLAINYTSGTTGKPKGVVYHHRGAYLQALAMAMHSGLDTTHAYLWTLPMFHCNGWCFTWATAAAGAVNVCLRSVEPPVIWRLLRQEGITHYSAAPTVLAMIANAPEATSGSALERPVYVHTGGAPPSPALLRRLRELRMEVTHLYGLTETYGPVAINQWKPEWNELPTSEQAVLKARQGVGNVIAERLRVVDNDGRDVPRDGQTVGEIVARGNDVMLGYYRDDAATAAVDLDGWFRTGDLAVVHSDGYVEIRDRSKDIIISGGENIASVEVERVIDDHPAVLESAVVGFPDETWGQVPVAFVTLRPDARVDADEIVEHVRSRLARFKAPKVVYFEDLPKTSTGKIQKHRLRARTVDSSADRVGAVR